MDPRSRGCSANTRVPICHRVFPLSHELRHLAFDSDPHKPHQYWNCTPNEKSTFYLARPTHLWRRQWQRFSQFHKKLSSHRRNAVRYSVTWISSSRGKNRLAAGNPRVTTKRKDRSHQLCTPTCRGAHTGSHHSTVDKISRCVRRISNRPP